MTATPGTLCERAERLAPLLGKRARTADECRSVDPHTIDQITKAGLVATLAPRAHGGLELGLGTASSISRILAGGCASTAWLVAFYAVHNWLVALYSAPVRERVFGADGYVLAPAVFSPTGSARRSGDGWSVNGRWAWGTGVEHAEWVMVNAIAETDGRPDPRLCLLPAAATSQIDTWHTSGMRATRSNDIVVEDVHVEDAFTIAFADVMRGTTPGARDLDGALYRYPIGPLLSLSAAAVAVGLGDAAVELVSDRARERVLAYSGGKIQRDDVGMQIRLGSARARVDAARLLYDDEIGTLEHCYTDGGAYDLGARARARLVAAHTVGECRRVVTSLLEASGASAQHLDSPLQRMQRDLNTLSGHVVFDEDAAAELAGKTLVGVDLPAAALI